MAYIIRRLLVHQCVISILLLELVWVEFGWGVKKDKVMLHNYHSWCRSLCFPGQFYRLCKWKPSDKFSRVNDLIDRNMTIGHNQAFLFLYYNKPVRLSVTFVLCQYNLLHLNLSPSAHYRSRLGILQSGCVCVSQLLRHPSQPVQPGQIHKVGLLGRWTGGGRGSFIVSPTCFITAITTH